MNQDKNLSQAEMRKLMNSLIDALSKWSQEQGIKENTCMLVLLNVFQLTCLASSIDEKVFSSILRDTLTTYKNQLKAINNES
jgi:hypothetical protein